jgi:hypothetical protein
MLPQYQYFSKYLKNETKVLLISAIHINSLSENANTKDSLFLSKLSTDMWLPWNPQLSQLPRARGPCPPPNVFHYNSFPSRRNSVSTPKRFTRSIHTSITDLADGFWQNYATNTTFDFENAATCFNHPTYILCPDNRQTNHEWPHGGLQRFKRIPPVRDALRRKWWLWRRCSPLSEILRGKQTTHVTCFKYCKTVFGRRTDVSWHSVQVSTQVWQFSVQPSPCCGKLKRTPSAAVHCCDIVGVYV